MNSPLPVCPPSRVFGPSRVLLGLLLLVGFAHLPLVASNLLLWDDTTLANLLDAHDSTALLHLFRDAGLPQMGLLHTGIGLLPGYIHAYNLISLACILGSADCIYRLARLAPLLGEVEAAFVAALAMTYPFYSLWADPIMLPYAVCLLLFLLAGSLYASRLQNFSLRSGPVWLAMALFFLSFTVESLLVFFYGLFAYFFWLAGGTRSRAEAWMFLRQHAPALALPPIFYVAKRLLFPVAGRYTEYNQIHPSLFNAAKGLAVAPKRIVGDQLVDLGRFVAHDASLFLILAAICLPACLAAGWLLARGQSRRLSVRELLGTLGLAAALFVAATFAYSAVEKFPLINNYNCRHALLAALPIALAVVACVRFAARSEAVFRWGMVAVLLLCTTLQWRSAIRWQNRSIKYQAIVENLRGEESRLTPIVVVADEANFGMPEQLRDYELNWMFKQALGDERHLGLTAAEADGQAEKTLGRDLNDWDRKNYMFQDLPYPKTDRPRSFDEDVTRIVVRAGEPHSELGIVTGYYFASPAQRRDLVKSLVEIKYDKTHLKASPAP